MCYYTGKTFFPSAQFDCNMKNRIGRIGKPIYTCIVHVCYNRKKEKKKKKFGLWTRGGLKIDFF